MYKRKPIRKKIRCGNCGADGHTSLMCWKKRREVIRVESPKKKQARLRTMAQWFEQNPPDEDGKWACYLGISPYCLRVITRDQLQLEHVYPKNKYPALRYITSNIKPSCGYCNSLKLSNTINQLCKFYPNLASLVSQPEWQAWEDLMESHALRLGIRLDRPEPGQLPLADLRG